MTTAKRAAKSTQTTRQGGPAASRPSMPGEYGIPKSRKGLLAWPHVRERMSGAMQYWVTTVDPRGRPHATPVDGLWIDDRLYFGGSPRSHRNRNLATNPAVCVHLESASDVVILHGDARELRAPDRALAVRVAQASMDKYGYGPKPEDVGAGGMFEFRPRVVFAWKQFPKDVTRWRLANGG